MNNKDFINALASKVNLPAKSTQKIVTSFINELANRLNDESSISVQSFGTFEVKKKMERVIVNPATKQRILTPPKLVLAFKPSNILKDKLK